MKPLYLFIIFINFAYASERAIVIFGEAHESLKTKRFQARYIANHADDTSCIFLELPKDMRKHYDAFYLDNEDYYQVVAEYVGLLLDANPEEIRVSYLSIGSPYLKVIQGELIVQEAIVESKAKVFFMDIPIKKLQSALKGGAIGTLSVVKQRNEHMAKVISDNSHHCSNNIAILGKAHNKIENPSEGLLSVSTLLGKASNLEIQNYYFTDDKTYREVIGKKVRDKATSFTWTKESYLVSEQLLSLGLGWNVFDNSDIPFDGEYIAFKENDRLILID